jgi:hypothetical protein
MVRGFASVIVVAAASSASAQPKPVAPPLVGGTEVIKLTTPAGFIDDVVTADGDRLGYVIADSASKAELHVVSLTSKQEHVVDLAPITLHPIAVQLVGTRAFVVGMDEGKQVGALVELDAKLKGKAVYTIAPATHITVITRDGKPRIAVHRVTSTSASTRHAIEVLALENGRRVGAARSLDLDLGKLHKALDFRVNHWSDGFTRAHGVKGGEWDRKENQRTPDVEATFDLVTGKLVDRKPIGDLFEQRRRFQALAEIAGSTASPAPAVASRLDLVRLGWDHKGILAWRAGKPHPIELDQPLATYDAQSLQGSVAPDGSAWLALKVDPVNAEAVARKKADVEYLDVFRAGPDGKAIRKARVLASGIRHRFGVAGDRFWLIERNQSMERGGKSLTVYQLQ